MPPHPRLVTELGIVIDFILLQSAKARSAMLSTEFGIVTEVKLEQSMKAQNPILLTEFPIFKDVKFLQFSYLLSVDYQYYTL